VNAIFHGEVLKVAVAAQPIATYFPKSLQL
jgi:hypothetical protein